MCYANEPLTANEQSRGGAFTSFVDGMLILLLLVSQMNPSYRIVVETIENKICEQDLFKNSLIFLFQWPSCAWLGVHVCVCVRVCREIKVEDFHYFDFRGVRSNVDKPSREITDLWKVAEKKNRKELVKSTHALDNYANKMSNSSSEITLSVCSFRQTELCRIVTRVTLCWIPFIHGCISSDGICISLMLSIRGIQIFWRT